MAVDPRSPAPKGDSVPVVALPGRGLPNWALGILAVIAGVVLFGVLQGKRQHASAPAVRPSLADSAGPTSAIAPLLVPADVPPPPPPPPPTLAAAPQPPMTAQPPRPPLPPRIVYLPAPPVGPSQAYPPPEPAVGRVSAGPALVFDDTPAGSPDATETAAASGSGASTATVVATGSAARASVLRRRSTTVPQGALIPAVLETALDTTRPGLARAIVSRDVRGFDGSRVLIPRGSRLVGDYRADVEPGQNRALITWTRLMRPDGAVIAIGSPVADPLGRVGVKGDVDQHFLARFGAAILQSTLDIGVNLASSAGGRNAGVIVALPNAAQTSTSSLTPGTQVSPTLSVRQGAAITVFVARDLDFTSVEKLR
jgi:type IV secretion system protein VirB10